MAVRSVAISADSTLMAAVNNAGNCYVWQLRGAEVFAFKKLAVHAPHYALRCAFSPDGTKLATTSSDHSVRVWDVTKDFALVHTLSAHKMWVWDCAFTADSACLITGPAPFCAAREAGKGWRGWLVDRAMAPSPVRWRAPGLGAGARSVVGHNGPRVGPVVGQGAGRAQGAPARHHRRRPGRAISVPFIGRW